MSNKVFFVTNASSKTGSFIAKLLLEVGKYTIRLGTRDPSKLSEFHVQGAEVVHVDHTL
jgi:NADP-dependent 3-hydroxy acid dehydrogenase YdfG